MSGQSKPFYCQIGLIHRYFNFSCTPNVANFDYDGDMMFITARPVKKGQELHLSYFWPLISNKRERQKAIWEQRETVCRCSLCGGTSASSVQQRRMNDDPDYRYILLNYKDTSHSSKTVEKQILEKCKTFLKRYAEVPWSKEIGIVVNAYKFTLSSEIATNKISLRFVVYEENTDLYV